MKTKAINTIDELEKINRQMISLQAKARDLADASDPDLCSRIRGQESAKRAIVVAAVQKQSLAFIGPGGCGKTMLVMVAAKVNVPAMEFRTCRCGNWSNPMAVCTCTNGSVKRWQDKLFKEAGAAEIQIEVPPPSTRDMQSKPFGLSLADLMRQILRAGELPIAEVSDCPGCRQLMRAATNQLALSARSQAIILKTAQSIAALDRKAEIEVCHLAEAIQYRRLERRSL